ncbi:hypothetical protein KL905_002979 [Ogataea polymorpha]|uniref:uncharacterized protein n=1 Tax=Ogataea polymorpha TaxID=460523 RepID=UPI0007F3CC8F|nr:uncharacterized protein OGAPODRAFT_6465 [Ogataea polymorpha]KAG7904848.1 hypothetical protein KL907_003064 [Ogataea polymorpha]KAG7908031.1 hypothetical protein KL906_003448 [Ogataea polymorpha]KAG7916614.1 hypothetical protein KL927_003253 [Ogataea polymorpha]KAG7921521.1 hypothetical protein KL905_002979 [Ogataea polymorpha]KAG7925975.1 hypothetical protein KL925_003737 [Ogataea polymorpha]
MKAVSTWLFQATDERPVTPELDLQNVHKLAIPSSPSPAQSEATSHIYTGTLAEGLELLAEALQKDSDHLSDAFARILDSMVDSGLVTSTLYKIDDELKFLILETFLSDSNLVERFKAHRQQNREQDALLAIERAKRGLEMASRTASSVSPSEHFPPEGERARWTLRFVEFVDLILTMWDLLFTGIIGPIVSYLYACLCEQSSKYDIGRYVATTLLFCNIILRRLVTLLGRLVRRRENSRITSSGPT